MTATTLGQNAKQHVAGPDGIGWEVPAGEPRPDPFRGWTDRDHADQYIVDMMVPLLELTDALPKLMELIGEHLLARFGNAESEELRVADVDVIRVADNLTRFTEGMQKMLAADRPRAMGGHPSVMGVMAAERVVVHAASNGHAAAEIPGWEER